MLLFFIFFFFRRQWAGKPLDDLRHFMGSYCTRVHTYTHEIIDQQQLVCKTGKKPKKKIVLSTKKKKSLLFINKKTYENIIIKYIKWKKNESKKINRIILSINVMFAVRYRICSRGSSPLVEKFENNCVIRRLKYLFYAFFTLFLNLKFHASYNIILYVLFNCIHSRIIV